MAEKFAALEKACGGVIKPETLTELRERLHEVPALVAMEYHEFMAGLAALFAPAK